MRADCGDLRQFQEGEISGREICTGNSKGVHSRDVRGGAFSSGAGGGEDKNPRGGAKAKIRGAGRWKRTRKWTDPKIRQKCVNCYGDICIVL